MSGFIRVGGLSKPLSGFYVAVGGVSKTVTKAWVFVGGVAKLFYDPTTPPPEEEPVVQWVSSTSEWVEVGVTWRFSVNFYAGAYCNSINHTGGVINTSPNSGPHNTGWQGPYLLAGVPSVPFSGTAFSGADASGVAGNTVSDTIYPPS